MCDWAWENLSYLHTNFDGIWSVITFSLNMMLILNFDHICTNHWRVCWNLLNCYSLPKKEIHNIRHMVVLCVDRQVFSGPVTYMRIHWLMLSSESLYITVVSFTTEQFLENRIGYVHLSKPTNTHCSVSCNTSLYCDIKKAIYWYV